ncbi:hypothetical protein J4218_04095 [Candidatus Pacearchaeota archaeon]|nr:hypothetical protein [Candidatus Pacearchaeota archaeon]
MKKRGLFVLLIVISLISLISIASSFDLFDNGSKNILKVTGEKNIMILLLGRGLLFIIVIGLFLTLQNPIMRFLFIIGVNNLEILFQDLVKMECLK